MIIYLNEDRAFLAWLRQHRGGFVLDAQRNSQRSHRTLHRATCETIRRGTRRHWTTSQRLKACSLDLAQLVQWASETGSPAESCAICCPQNDRDESIADGDLDQTLTPLSANLLNYVLESCLIELRQAEPEYALTLDEMTTSLHKTARQLAGPLRRLLDGKYVRLSSGPRADGSFPPATIIWPTSKGLRTLPDFAEMSTGELEAELAKLMQQQECG
jgi:hypothetical protein